MGAADKMTIMEADALEISVCAVLWGYNRLRFIKQTVSEKSSTGSDFVFKVPAQLEPPRPWNHSSSLNSSQHSTLKYTTDIYIIPQRC